MVQLRSGRDVTASLDAAEASIREAAAGGANYIQTPENTGLMELDAACRLAACEIEEGNTALARLSALGAELQVWLHVGSLAVRAGDDRLANRSFLIAPDGHIASRYDKLHLFDVDLPDGEVYRESRDYDCGKDAVIADLPWGRLGLSICYDLRFAALYRALAEAGADMLAVPSAFTAQTGRAHWEILLRARAIETGCWVFAAAQGGIHENGRATWGHSMIVSPWGDVVAQAGEEPCVIFADIDMAEVAEARARIPALRHGRAIRIGDGR